MGKSMENKMFNMKLTILFAAVIFIIGMSAGMAAAVDPNDVLVWQGQYYTGTTFNEGTYEFNFTVYDASTGGTQCYSNVTSLTTGSWGEWKTEQYGVSGACNNVSKNYFLNININGTDQLPRKRLTTWNFLRKNVDETTSGNFQTSVQIIAPIVNAGSQVVAPTINATQVVANEIIVNSGANILGVLRGHSPLKIGDSIQYVDKNDANLFSVYTAGANITGNNVSSQYNGVIIHQIETHTNPSGIEECWWDKEDQQMRMCMDKTSIEMWNDLIINKNVNITGNASANTGFFSYLGSLAVRITKLFVQDIDATGNIETSQNVSANYFKGDGSLLTNLPAGINGTNGKDGVNGTQGPQGIQGIQGEKGDKGDTGAQGIQGIPGTNGTNGVSPNYLGGDLNATNAARVNVFTIALTPSKMNVIHAYLVQSSSKNGVAIQNRAILSASGPVGNCNFATQTGAGAQAVDNIAVSNNSADTSVTSMALDINVPFINTATCAVLADANQRNLTVQFISETVSTVTTYAGSYYTNAVS
jgi:hypothetical protein